MYTKLRLIGHISFVVLYDITFFLYTHYNEMYELQNAWFQLCVHTKSACSRITFSKQPYIDMAFFTQNNSHNNILKFGRPDGEHTIYINEFALFHSCSVVHYCLQVCGRYFSLCY